MKKQASLNSVGRVEIMSVCSRTTWILQTDAYRFSCTREPRYVSRKICFRLSFIATRYQ